jgi:hypothetical protein
MLVTTLLKIFPNPSCERREGRGLEITTVGGKVEWGKTYGKVGKKKMMSS